MMNKNSYLYKKLKKIESSILDFKKVLKEENTKKIERAKMVQEVYNKKDSNGNR